MLGIVVVNRRGASITFGQAVGRNVLRVIDGMFSWALGLLVMHTNRNRQRVGDIAVGTIVVRKARPGAQRRTARAQDRTTAEETRTSH